jgi:FG-GAP-like repeat
MSGVERALRRAVVAAVLCVAGSAAAQSFPTYVSCTVPSARLGTSVNGFQAGVAGFLSDDPSPDLVLIDSSRVVVELTDSALWAKGSCPEAIVESRPIELPGVQGITLVEDDAISDLGITVRPSSAVLYIGDGTGSFSAGPSITTLGEVGAITAARVDGDNRPELIVADSNTVKVLTLNTQTVMYDVAQTLTLTGGNVKVIGAAPLNNDGRVDIVAVDVLGNVHIFLQDATGMFIDQGSPTAGSLQVAGAVAMQIVDVNNDTTPDLLFAVSDGATGTLEVYRGAQQEGGTVAYTLSQSLPAGIDPSALAVGNLNGGGPLDAVVTDRAANQIRFYRGNASGMFDQPNPPLNTGPSPNGVLLADLDRDGRADPVTTNAGDGSLTAFLSSQPPPTATFTPTNTAVNTLTATPTPTPSATPTDTPTFTPTGTPTATPTPTVTATGTFRTPTSSPTVTCVGFCVQGQGCADIAGGSRGRSGGAAMPLLVLAAFLLLRRLRL